jgi:exodeoxyribonuclease V alpha subunit
MPADSQITLEGRIERIVFANPQTNYMVARFRADQQQQLVTVVGHLPEPRPGERLRLQGGWKQHPKYGAQFQAQSFEIMLPSEVEEIRAYLESGVIKGIGAKTAEKLIRHFQGETLTVIENEPERLARIRGIGPETARRIAEAWAQHHAVRTLMRFLQTHQIPPAHAARIYKFYGTDALDILTHDPYRLAADIPRVGFYVADAVARQSDLPIDALQRARACLRFLLEEAAEEGHMFVALDQLTLRCGEAFALDYHDLRTAVAQLEDEGAIRVGRQAPDVPVYLKAFYEAEVQVAQRMQAKLAIAPTPVRFDRTQILDTVVRRLAIALSEAQLEILQSVLDQRAVIITGGPGTGKTTLIRSIAALFEAVGRRYILAAPTGRAARRMAEVTGCKAVTLHKLLGFSLSENQFERDQDDPLETDALIVDEASMVDGLLMGHLIKALPLRAVLILVGDVFQLPSVGPGSVLADLIQANLVRTFELTEVFRQAAQSPIILQAHRVRQGLIPELPPLEPVPCLSPFTFIERGRLEQVAELVVELTTRILPEQCGVDPVREVQVLTPMHKGVVGTLQLNQMLQSALNPQHQGIKAFAGRFFLNDKVMQLRNNYLKEVFNGEIGIVSVIDVQAGTLTAAFEGRMICYDEAEAEELALAYAISVHKSQGSEYPVVVMPIVTQHYIMLQRNLLYTALTRAQQMVILVGSPKAVRIAVASDTPRQRRSLLAWRLSQGAVE